MVSSVTCIGEAGYDNVTRKVLTTCVLHGYCRTDELIRALTIWTGQAPLVWLADTLQASLTLIDPWVNRQASSAPTPSRSTRAAVGATRPEPRWWPPSASCRAC
jgi:hypothetical protein